jgi:transcriptional regulator with XRE-family HTH domain
MTKMRSVDEVHQERLEGDPAVRAAWARTAFARAVANRVLGYRIEHGLTQSALAKRLGMRQPAISRLELGKHSPSVDTLLRLSGILGMEFLLHVLPTSASAHWPEPEPDAATILESVESATSASSVVAAAR